MEKLKYITNPRLIHVAIVDKPSNKKKWTKIIKSENIECDGLEEIEYNVKISKVDDEQRIIYGEVYTPYQVDTQNMFTTPTQIRKMAHDFLGGLRDGRVDMNYMHVANSQQILPVESFIASDDSKEYTPGAWVLGSKVLNDGMWEQVQKGEISGYSLQAYAELLDVDFGDGDEVVLPNGEVIMKSMIKKRDSKEYAYYDAESFVQELKSMIDELKPYLKLTKREDSMSRFGDLIQQWEVSSNIDDAFMLLRRSVEEKMYAPDVSLSEKRKAIKAEVKDFGAFMEQVVEKEQKIIDERNNEPVDS